MILYKGRYELAQIKLISLRYKISNFSSNLYDSYYIILTIKTHDNLTLINRLLDQAIIMLV